MEFTRVHGPYQLSFLVPKHDRTQGPLIERGVYEEYVTKAIVENTKQQGTFLDLGSNVGYFSCIAARLGHHVISVEASPQNAALTLLNLKQNFGSTEARYEVIPVAASNSWGTSIIEGSSETNKSLNPVSKINQNSLLVLKANLDDIVTSHVDYLKVDIEGFEPLVAKTNIFQYQPRVIFLELNPSAIDLQCKINAEDFLKELKDYGFAFTLLSRKEIGYVEKSISAVLKELDSVVKKGGTHIDLMLTRQ